MPSIFETIDMVADKIEKASGAVETLANLGSSSSGATRLIDGNPMLLTSPLPAKGQNGEVVTVGELPLWLDFETQSGPRGWILRNLFAGGHARTQGEFKRIGSLDPISGIAAAGTPISTLSVPQQRAYMGNSYVIGSAATYNDAQAFAQINASLKDALRELGLENVAGVDKAHKYTSQDAMDAMPRLSSKGGAAPKINIRSSGSGTMTAAPRGGPIMPAPLQECLTRPYGARNVCVRDVLRANPEYAALYEATIKPWKDVANPTRILQYAIGLDGKRYVVLGKGAKAVGIPGIYFVWAGVTASIAGTLAVSGALFYAFGTKSGKDMRKSAMKRIRG